MDLSEILLQELSSAVKSIQIFQVLADETQNKEKLQANSKPVKTLLTCLDKIFLHGLRNANNGYWKLVKDYCPKDMLETVQRLKNTTNINEGHAWLFYVLNENLLESFLTAIQHSPLQADKFYFKFSVLASPKIALLIDLTRGLEFVSFSLNMEELGSSGTVKSFESLPKTSKASPTCLKKTQQDLGSSVYLDPNAIAKFAKFGSEKATRSIKGLINSTKKKMTTSETPSGVLLNTYYHFSESGPSEPSPICLLTGDDGEQNKVSLLQPLIPPAGLTRFELSKISSEQKEASTLLLQELSLDDFPQTSREATILNDGFHVASDYFSPRRKNPFNDLGTDYASEDSNFQFAATSGVHHNSNILFAHTPIEVEHQQKRKKLENRKKKPTKPEMRSQSTQCDEIKLGRKFCAETDSGLMSDCEDEPSLLDCSDSPSGKIYFDESYPIFSTSCPNPGSFKGLDSCLPVVSMLPLDKGVTPTMNVVKSEDASVESELLLLGQSSTQTEKPEMNNEALLNDPLGTKPSPVFPSDHKVTGGTLESVETTNYSPNISIAPLSTIYENPTTDDCKAFGLNEPLASSENVTEQQLQNIPSQSFGTKSEVVTDFDHSEICKTILNELLDDVCATIFYPSALPFNIRSQDQFLKNANANDCVVYPKSLTSHDELSEDVSAIYPSNIDTSSDEGSDDLTSLPMYKVTEVENSIDKPTTDTLDISADTDTNSFDGMASSDSERKSTHSCVMMVDNNLLLKLMLSVVNQEDEKITQVLRVSSNCIMVSTDKLLYMVRETNDAAYENLICFSYSKVFVELLCHKQGVNFIDEDTRKCLYRCITSDPSVAKVICSSFLEAKHNSSTNPTNTAQGDQPSSEMHVAALKKAVFLETGQHKDIDLYRCVHIMDSKFSMLSERKEAEFQYKSTRVKLFQSSWVEAHFVLHSNILYHFKHRNSETHELSWHLESIQHCRVLRSNPSSFRIFLKDGKVIELKTASPAVSQDWVETINFCLLPQSQVTPLSCSYVITDNVLFFFEEELDSMFCRCLHKIAFSEISCLSPAPSSSKCHVKTKCERCRSRARKGYCLCVNFDVLFSSADQCQEFVDAIRSM